MSRIEGDTEDAGREWSRTKPTHSITGEGASSGGHDWAGIGSECDWCEEERWSKNRAAWKVP